MTSVYFLKLLQMTSNDLKLTITLFIALDYQSRPLRIRLNVGQNWAQVRTGPPGDRNRFLKGFRPSRRVLQVSETYSLHLFVQDSVLNYYNPTNFGQIGLVLDQFKITRQNWAQIFRLIFDPVIIQ